MSARLVQLVFAALTGAVLTATTIRPDPPSPVLTAADIGFAQDMSAHHQQAVTMSDMLTSDAGPDVRALADQIRTTQLVEVGQLTGWLQLVDAPPSAPAPMAWMHEGADHPMAAGMPGMASPAELVRLQRSSGPANATLYLQLMIRHHQGGIDMAAHAVRETPTDAVRRIAATMLDEQTQETQVMTVLLEQRGHAALPYP